MIIKDLLIDTAFNVKILANRKDFGIIPEAEPIIEGGSFQIFEAVSGAAEVAGSYHSDIVLRACRYLFGKAVEAVILWGRSPNGKFNLFFNSAAIASENVFKDLPADYRENIKGVSVLADNLFNAHAKLLSSREHELDTVKLHDEIKELLIWCSRIGMAYALEHKYHELPGGNGGTKSPVMHMSKEILEAAAAGALLTQAKEC